MSKSMNAIKLKKFPPRSDTHIHSPGLDALYRTTFDTQFSPLSSRRTRFCKIGNWINLGSLLSAKKPDFFSIGVPKKRGFFLRGGGELLRGNRQMLGKVQNLGARHWYIELRKKDSKKTWSESTFIHVGPVVKGSCCRRWDFVLGPDQLSSSPFWEKAGGGVAFCLCLFLMELAAAATPQPPTPSLCLGKLPNLGGRRH